MGTVLAGHQAPMRQGSRAGTARGLGAPETAQRPEAAGRAQLNPVATAGGRAPGGGRRQSTSDGDGG
eukprot:1622504-Alexandrium_andersonii.AAC.1